MSHHRVAGDAGRVSVLDAPQAGRKRKRKFRPARTASARSAVREPANKWWEGLGLESPEALLKIFVQRSGCFTLVDRGKGFEMAQQERALAAGGALQGGSNIGGGQVRAADYILVPDIVSKNSNAGGTNVGGLIGGFMGGFAGAIVSGISINSKSADVILSVTNVRTSEQQAMAEGHGDKTDVGFSLGGGGFGGGAFGARGRLQLPELRHRPGGRAGLYRRLYQAGGPDGRPVGRTPRPMRRTAP